MLRKRLHNLQTGKRYSVNFEEGNQNHLEGVSDPCPTIIPEFKELTIGRSKETDITVPNDHGHVSGSHLRVYASPHGERGRDSQDYAVYVRNLGRNGTDLIREGVVIPLDQDQRLQHGDVLVLAPSKDKYMISYTESEESIDAWALGRGSKS